MSRYSVLKREKTTKKREREEGEGRKDVWSTKTMRGGVHSRKTLWKCSVPTKMRGKNGPAGSKSKRGPVPPSKQGGKGEAKAPFVKGGTNTRWTVREYRKRKRKSQHAETLSEVHANELQAALAEGRPSKGKKLSERGGGQ